MKGAWLPVVWKSHFELMGMRVTVPYLKESTRHFQTGWNTLKTTHYKSHIRRKDQNKYWKSTPLAFSFWRIYTKAVSSLHSNIKTRRIRETKMTRFKKEKKRKRGNEKGVREMFWRVPLWTPCLSAQNKGQPLFWAKAFKSVFGPLPTPSHTGWQL